MGKDFSEKEAQLCSYNEFINTLVNDFISKNHLTPDYFLQVRSEQGENYVDLCIQIDIWGITVEEFIEIYQNNTLQIIIAWEWEERGFWDFVPAIEAGDEYPFFYLCISRESIHYLEKKYLKLAEGARREKLIDDFANNLFVLKSALEKRIADPVSSVVNKYTNCYSILIDGFKKWMDDNFSEYDDISHTDAYNKKIERKPNDEIVSQLRTSKATNTRVESQIIHWKGVYFPAMVRIYSTMDKDKKYTKKEVAHLFEKEGLQIKVSKRGIITDAKIDYFWRMFISERRPLKIYPHSEVRRMGAVT